MRVEKRDVLAEDGEEQVLPHLLRHPLACKRPCNSISFSILLHQDLCRSLTNAGETVDVGERHGTLCDVELDHLESGLFDLGEETFDGLCSSCGFPAPGNHVHNVAEKLRNLPTVNRVQSFSIR